MAKQIVIDDGLDTPEKREKARIERIKRRRKENQKMRYTPKERQAYLKALRYGRRQKAGGEFKAVPRVKFNGGSLGVAKDRKGNVHVFANNREGYKVTELGPRGARRETDFSYLNDKQAQWEGKYGTKEKGYVFKRLFGF